MREIKDCNEECRWFRYNECRSKRKDHKYDNLDYFEE